MTLNKIRVLVGIGEPYTREKIAECFKFRPEYEVSIYDKSQNEVDFSLYDFLWLEYEDLDFETLLDRKKINTTLFNSYCIRKGLIRKAQIAFYLKKYLTKKLDSSLARFMPETYVFVLDYVDYLDEALNDCFEVELALENNLKLSDSEFTKKFILKSSMTNKGAEILLFDTKSQLENYFNKRVENSEDETLDLREWVIQAYLDRPLLLNNYQNRKFHLRVYVLAVGNLQVYVYNDILALFSKDSYKNEFKLPSEDSRTNFDLKSHITNTCYQLEDVDKNNNRKEWEKIENECVKRFWSLNLDENDNPTKNQEKLDHIFNQIKSCTGEIFGCLMHEPTVFQPLENAFELYGFDYMLDENLNCYFLEANAFPDFKQTGDSLNDLIDCLFYHTIALTSDVYFENSKMCDTSRKMSLVLERQK
jgi:tubulin--tyrosine ligase